MPADTLLRLYERRKRLTSVRPFGTRNLVAGGALAAPIFGQTRSLATLRTIVIPT